MRASPRMSPALSGLLNDVVYKEEAVEMSPEEASLLQEEIDNISKQIESDTADLGLVSKSLNRVLELTEDMNTAVDTNTTDNHTASLLLSEFASIYKDTLGQEFTYSKNLSNNPLEVKQILTAGLQSAKGFIETLKKIAKKIWESLKAAWRWFWSKIKQFISWILGGRNKARKRQESNSAGRAFSEAMSETGDNIGKYKKSSNPEEDIINDVHKNFKKNMTDAGIKENINNTHEIFKDAEDILRDYAKAMSEMLREAEEMTVKSKISFYTDRAANKVALSIINKIETDKRLAGNISAIAAVYKAGILFKSINGSYFADLSPALKDAISKSSYPVDGKYFSLKIENLRELATDWRDNINNHLRRDSLMFSREKEYGSHAIGLVFNSMYDLEAYDILVGLKTAGAAPNNAGIINSINGFLSQAYSSYWSSFRRINEVVEEAKLEDSKDSRDLQLVLNKISNISIGDSLVDRRITYDSPITEVAAMPVGLHINSSDNLVCSWVNILVSDSVVVDSINLDALRKETIRGLETSRENKDWIFSVNREIERAILELKNKPESFSKKISPINTEEEINRISDVQKKSDRLIEEIDKYMTWFSSLDTILMTTDSSSFKILDGLAYLIEHINKLKPSFSLDMLRSNQLILNSVLESIDLKEEIVKAYRDIMAEQNI